MPQLINKVKIKNRADCCGDRLAKTKVFIDNQYCGSLPDKTANNKWFEVKCAKPLRGKSAKLVTVQNTFLSIQGFEAYTTTKKVEENSAKIVLHKTSQSSNYLRTWTADKCINGSHHPDACVTMAGKGQWWKA